MKKYKICPSCQTKNEPIFLECINCEADLTGVKITDEDTEKMLETNTTKQDISATSFVKICECGTKNPPNARKCSSCREDISDIIPIPDYEKFYKEEVDFILSSIDGQYTYKITTDVVTIGRENIMKEYLSTKNYVSRAHAKLILENNHLYIENLSNTNFTYVNNRKINMKTKLQDGDEVGLGGTSLKGNRQNEAAYFWVRSGRCI